MPILSLNFTNFEVGGLVCFCASVYKLSTYTICFISKKAFLLIYLNKS